MPKNGHVHACAAANGDPFVRHFFARIPAELADTFTAAQLDAVKLAFGARSRGAHAVDVRLSLPLLSRRFYVVLLAGKERRSRERRLLDRLLRPFWTYANAVVVVAFLLVLAGAAFATVYAVKRALGIDAVPGIDMLPDQALERLLR